MAADIAAGPALILLAGPEGCGKTYTLVAVATDATRLATSIRSPDQPARPGVVVDMVDDVDSAAADGLLELPDSIVRVLAVQPQLVPIIRARCPEARVVQMQPMTPRDVRAFVEVRRSELPPPVDAYVARALAKLAGCEIRSPAVADRLIERICDEAVAVRSRGAAAQGLGQAAVAAAPSRRGNGALHHSASPSEPFVDAAWWALTLSAPAVIAQTGPAMPARWRSRLIGAGALAAVLVLALGFAMRPEPERPATDPLAAPLADNFPTFAGPADDGAIAAPHVALLELPAAAAAGAGLQAVDPDPAAALRIPVSAEFGPLRAAAIPPQPAPDANGTDAKDASRLLHLGELMVAIGQESDGRKLLEAAVDRGSAEAADLMAAHGWARPARVAASRAPGRPGPKTPAPR